ncbi:MAG: hypothetical protein EDX89_09540 [Acidobacteria bacterium]|nr:MAG: hypothetical protein EDX89_09540 [Acidobacteriota bacterium]
MSPAVGPALYAVLVAASAVAALLGFAREAAVAALFGASRQADTFYAALSVPFVLAHFLAGGALAPVLTTALATRLERGAREEARGLLARVGLSVAFVFAASALVVGLLHEPVTRLLVPGFSTADRALTGSLLLDLHVYGAATALALVGSAALGAAGAYRTPPLALVLGNALALGVLLALRAHGVAALAWALGAGALLQLAVVAGRLASLGLLGLPRRAAGDGGFPAREAFWLALSLGAAGAVDLLERPFASAAGAGAVALLAYAGKLIHLPMRLVAAPLASVAFPRLVRGRARADERAPREAGETADRVFLLLSWSAATTAAAALPIAAATFGRGRFGAEAVARLADLLVLLSPAVIAVGLVEILSKYLLADGRARSVALAQGAGLLVYLLAAPLLSRHGAPGLAGARSLAWTAAAVALALALAARSRQMRLLARAPSVLLCALLAAVAAGHLVERVPGASLIRSAAGAAAAAAVLGALLLARNRLVPAEPGREPAP